MRGQHLGSRNPTPFVSHVTLGRPLYYGQFPHPQDKNLPIHNASEKIKVRVETKMLCELSVKRLDFILFLPKKQTTMLYILSLQWFQQTEHTVAVVKEVQTGAIIKSHFILSGMAATEMASTGNHVEKPEASNYSFPATGRNEQ